LGIDPEKDEELINLAY